MALQNSINRKTSDTRLDAIANQANPAAAKYFQLNTDGTVSFVDPGAASSDPNKVDKVTFTLVTSSRALALSDLGQFLGCNSSSAIVITVPKDATTNFDVGSFVEIGQIGTGSVTIAQEDNTVNIRRFGSSAVTSHVLAGVGAATFLKKTAANEWYAIGGIDPGITTSFDSSRLQPVWANDFLGLTTGTSTLYSPFVGAAVSAGTIAAPNAGLTTRSHPGVVKFRSSTTANSGYIVGVSNTQLLLGGGEIFECIFNITTLTNGTFRVGFIDTTTSADCVDGAYFEIASTGAVIAKTSNNSTRTTSAALFTAATATWYRARITVNNAANQVDFLIVNDAGTTQGSTSLTTNIPTASGRETGAGIIATNSGTTATDLLHLDYMSYASNQVLVR